MSVVLSREEVGPCRLQLKIEVPAPAVEAETDRVTDEFAREVKMPGFRKGKVPRGVIRKRFGKDIEKEVVERLVPRYWRQAEAEAGIEPLIEPELESVDHPEGEPMVFTAVVETRPEITLGDLDNFELPERVSGATDADVDAAVEDIRRQVSPWVETDRAAGQGDLVVVAITPQNEEGGDSDSEAPREPDRVDIEVGSPQVWEELSVALTGKKAGQKGEFTRIEAAPEPEDGGDAAEAAETAETPEPVERRFHFEVETVKERDLVDLDDDFAKNLGPFESFDALRDDISNRLSAEKRSASDQERERLLLDQLRARHPLALPAGVVEREAQQLLHDYAENLARRGVDIEKAEVDWQGISEQMKPLAERRVHARLVLDAVAKERDVTVSEDEFERTLAGVAQAQGTSTPALRQALDREGRLAAIRRQMAREKTIRQLLGDTEDEEGNPAAVTDETDEPEVVGAAGDE